MKIDNKSLSYQADTEIDMESTFGIATIIESVLSEMNVNLYEARQGKFNWVFKSGSATINIYYYEKEGVIVGEVKICQLPQKDLTEIFKYLLKQNNIIKHKNFSIHRDTVILSIILQDQELSQKSVKTLIENLSKSADHYDDILVKDFGALWINSKL